MHDVHAIHAVELSNSHFVVRTRVVPQRRRRSRKWKKSVSRTVFFARQILFQEGRYVVFLLISRAFARSPSMSSRVKILSKHSRLFFGMAPHLRMFLCKL